MIDFYGSYSEWISTESEVTKWGDVYDNPSAHLMRDLVSSVLARVFIERKT